MYEAKSMDELLKNLIVQAKKQYVTEFTKDFKTRLGEKWLTLDDLIKSGGKLREEILKERGLL